MKNKILKSILVCVVSAFIVLGIFACTHGNQQKTDTTVNVSKIILDKTKLDMSVNDTVKLTATVNPNNASDKLVLWETTDENVATVAEDGTISAKAVGACAIIAKTKTSSSVGICVIQVTQNQTTGDVTGPTEPSNPTNPTEPNDPTEPTEPSNPTEATTVSVESVSLDKQNLSLVVGDYYSFITTVLPENATDKSVTYTSSDKSVATVFNFNGGLVVATGVGNCTITATTNDGEKTYTCDIDVRVAVDGISLDKNSLIF